MAALQDGKTLPAGLATGSYEFRDLTHKGAGTLFEGKVIYDKTYGHAAYGCALCRYGESRFGTNSAGHSRQGIKGSH